jgi:hypothetical protein
MRSLVVESFSMLSTVAVDAVSILSHGDLVIDAVGSEGQGLGHDVARDEERSATEVSVEVEVDDGKGCAFS